MNVVWRIPGVDRYVHFSGPVFFYEIPLKVATRICQFSQYLGTKLDMLFEIAKSVEIVTILRKTTILKSEQSALSDLKRPPERLQSQCNYRLFIT